MRFRLRMVVAAALLLGAYVLVAAVAARVVTTLVAAILTGDASRVLWPLLVGAVTLPGLGRGLLAGMRPVPRMPGVVVTEHEQPRLWAEVHAAARYAGTRAPDEIRIGPVCNAAVSEDARWMGLVAGRRSLYLGAPLLVGLTELQLRAVLGHELGHYSGRHTRLSATTYRGQVVIARVVRHVRFTYAGWLFWLYGRLYLTVAASVNRRQELEADRCAAELAGANTLVAALRQLLFLGAAWHLFTREFVDLGSDQGLRPRDLYTGYQVYLHQETARRDLTATRVLAERWTESSGRYDTHPTLARRAAALVASGAPDVIDRTGPAFRLLEQPDPLLRRVEDLFVSGLPGRATERVTWEQLAARVGATRARAGAGRLVASPVLRGPVLGGYDAGEPAALGAVLDVLRDGRAEALGRSLLPQEKDPAALRFLATRHVGDLLADRLVSLGGCHRVDWAGTIRMVGAAGEPLDPYPPVRAAVEDHRRVPALEEWLRAHGVEWVRPALPVAAPVIAPVTGPPVSGAVAVLAPLEPVAGGGRGLVVRDHGLLLRRDAGDLELSWDQLEAVEVGGPLDGRLTVTVAVRPGVQHVMRVLPATRVDGDPWGVIREHLGDRLSTGR